MLEVLRGVACNHDRHVGLAGAVDRLARHGAGVRVDEERARVGSGAGLGGIIACGGIACGGVIRSRQLDACDLVVGKKTGVLGAMAPHEACGSHGPGRQIVAEPPTEVIEGLGERNARLGTCRGDRPGAAKERDMGDVRTALKVEPLVYQRIYERIVQGVEGIGIAVDPAPYD